MLKQESNSKSFAAFIKILKSRGLKGIWLHLLNIFFDVRRGIDTAERHKIANIEKCYVTTAQSAIKTSLIKAINFLYQKNNFKKFNFIELGVGKGKVVIILKELIFKRYKKIVDVLAIEIDPNLCEILVKNLLKTGFSVDKENNFIIKENNHHQVNTKVFHHDIDSFKTKNKLKEFCNAAHNIYYCCDSLTKESLLNLFKQIIINKNSSFKNIDILIYSNPRYLNEILATFGDGVKIITHKLGFPQESYAILEIKRFIQES